MELVSFYVDAFSFRSKRMRVFLIRHATHDHYGRILSGRSEGVPLTAHGRDEALRLAERLAQAGIASVHSSPRQRCLETATAIGRAVKQEVRVMDALDEIDFGDWSGLSFRDLEDDARWAAWNGTRSRCRPPGGESMAEATTRTVGYLEAQSETASPLACVTHCDVIRGVIGHYLGLDPDHILRFDIDPASISILDIGSWGGKVAALNRVAA